VRGVGVVHYLVDVTCNDPREKGLKEWHYTVCQKCRRVCPMTNTFVAVAAVIDASKSMAAAFAGEAISTFATD